MCESCGLLWAYECQRCGIYVAYLPHFEQWVNRTTADIKHVLNFDWHRVSAATVHDKGAMGEDTQPRLVGYHRRDGALTSIIVYILQLQIYYSLKGILFCSYVIWLRRTRATVYSFFPFYPGSEQSS